MREKQKKKKGKFNLREMKLVRLDKQKARALLDIHLGKETNR